MALKICVIGLWHLGCVTMCSMARRHSVVAFDPDSGVMGGLAQGKPPIFEPGLEGEISRARANGSLKFEPDLAQALSGADVVWFTFDLPVNERDEAQAGVLEAAFTKALEAGASPKAFVVSSQVPVGTCRRLMGKCSVPVIYIPENLRLGDAMRGFFSQERVVIGTPDGAQSGLAEGLMEGVEGERVFLGLESAEMAKHALNSYLALMISFSGEISDICEAQGANAIEVMDVLRKERRVSPHAPLSPGLGFGGGTLARDVQSLRAAAGKGGLQCPLLDAVMASNGNRKGYVKRRLEGALGKLDGKKISFLGLTYKPGTDTLRRSLALEIIAGLNGTGARIFAYDPAVKRLGGGMGISLCSGVEGAFDKADAVVITTAWAEFSGIDFERLAPTMRTQVLIDARNMLCGKKLPSQMKYYGVGVGNGKI